jgi:hypothetical protein
MNWITLSALTICVVLMSGCIFQSYSPGNVTPHVIILGITPDKPVYHSKELMKLGVDIDASSALERVFVNASGLRPINKKTNLLSKSQMVDLDKGVNNILFNYTMPSCSTCTGLTKGSYTVNVTVEYSGDLLTYDTVEIRIEQ